jgi:quinol monooxygenase YgiN
VMSEYEVVLIAEATALPGKRDELKRAIDELIPKSLAEEGIDVFRLHENRDKPVHFMLYERFRSQAAIDSHFASEHFTTISTAVAHLAEVVSRRSLISTCSATRGYRSAG